SRVAFRSQHRTGIRPLAAGPDIEVSGDQVSIPGRARGRKICRSCNRADDLQPGPDVASVTLRTLLALGADRADRTGRPLVTLRSRRACSACRADRPRAALDA